MMNSELFKLPEGFGIGESDTLVYFYSNNVSSVKNRVVFTKNMFCFLQHGIKEVQSVGGKEVITNDDVLMLTCGSTLMSESVSKNGKYEAILLFFGNKTLTNFCVKHGVQVKQRATPTSIVKTSSDDFIKNYCQSLQLLSSQQDPQMEAVKVEEVLLYMLKKHSDTFHQFVAGALSDNGDIKLKEIVESNLDSGLSVEELAFLCNMSLSTFKRHFAEMYHTSPQKYFTHIKMEKAKRLLLLNHKPSAIYSALGYEHLAAFSNEFKKHVGQSPRLFQNTNGRTEKIVERFA
jgi:AraC family transcriptional regulator, exoenzyme S synthesis regulatory protein ExsA